MEQCPKRKETRELCGTPGEAGEEELPLWTAPEVVVQERRSLRQERHLYCGQLLRGRY